MEQVSCQQVQEGSAASSQVLHMASTQVSGSKATVVHLEATAASSEVLVVCTGSTAVRLEAISARTAHSEDSMATPSEATAA